MTKITRLILTIVVLIVFTSMYANGEQPWEVNDSITQVTCEVIRTYPEAGTAVNVWRRYVGSGGEMEEVVTWEAVSDTPDNPQRRWSADNGLTWSDYEAMPDIVSYVNGARIYWAAGPYAYDPAAQATVSIWLRQTTINGIDYNHCFSRVSRDNGHTWSDPQLLRYEDGAEFDSANPLNPEFLDNNQAYCGQNLYMRSDGSLLFGGASANIPDDAPNPNPYNVSAPYMTNDARNIGGVNFVGRWNAEQEKYDWSGSSVSWVPRQVSSRGMMEPAVAELQDGRLLTVYRCSNDNLGGYDQPGRKRYTVSSDGGQTLSEVMELKYDDGTQFFSPSAYHNFIRHSQTGKLYWIGNIIPSPASGNSPRYPLIIAEVDEEDISLKKNTVTLIDTRRDGDGSGLQLSNFALLENRATHNIEIYLTRFGEDSSNVFSANAYKYTVSLGASVIQGLSELDSSEFLRRYEMDVLPSVADLDENGTPDFRYDSYVGGTATVAGGILTISSPAPDANPSPGNSFSSIDDGTIWPGNFTQSYTVELRLNVHEGTQTEPNSASSLYVINPCRYSLGWFNVSENGQSWGTYAGTSIGEGKDNCDEYHTFRIAYDASVNKFYVWRDGILIGEELSPADVWTGEDRLIFGDLSGYSNGTVEYDYLRFTPGAYAPVSKPGDANKDGKVDAADAAILAENWQTQGTATWAMGDFNGDGNVDDIDAAIMAANWGCSSFGGNASVPEPGTILLLVSGLIAIFSWLK